MFKIDVENTVLTTTRKSPLRHPQPNYNYILLAKLFNTTDNKLNRPI